MIVFECSNIGVSGTTNCYIQKNTDGLFEARIGISLLGSVNMTDEQFDECNHNPWHEKFYDNFASGIGETEEDAINAMKSELKSIADSLWY